jgi:hypothetical protein
MFPILAGQFGEAWLASNQVVSQVYEEWLIAHRRACTKHRVSEAKRFSLPNVYARHMLGHDALYGRQQVGLACVLQGLFEFCVRVEVILDRSFGGTCHENEFRGARRDGFLDRVLDQGLVHDRQHLFRAGLGGWQKSRTTAGDREYGRSY